MIEVEGIKEEIIKVVKASGRYYRFWTIGITQDPAARKEQHGNPRYWHEWLTGPLDSAREVEDYFINEKHMKGGPGGKLDEDEPSWIYIF